MLPEWAYGLFQSKDRYTSQAEILDIASQYRARHIPMDAIVQDWYWWTKGGEGDPVFNSNYTDVPAELKTLHDEHVHAMISVWGMMDETAKNFQEIKRRGFEIDDTHVYDPTNPAGRDFFWNQLAGQALRAGLGCLLARQRGAGGALAAHGRRHPARQATPHRQRP